MYIIGHFFLLSHMTCTFRTIKHWLTINCNETVTSYLETLKSSSLAKCHHLPKQFHLLLTFHPDGHMSASSTWAILALLHLKAIAFERLEWSRRTFLQVGRSEKSISPVSPEINLSTTLMEVCLCRASIVLRIIRSSASSLFPWNSTTSSQCRSENFTNTLTWKIKLMASKDVEHCYFVSSNSFKEQPNHAIFIITILQKVLERNLWALNDNSRYQIQKVDDKADYQRISVVLNMMSQFHCNWL